jgi:hypothetical protein
VKCNEDGEEGGIDYYDEEGYGPRSKGDRVPFSSGRHLDLNSIVNKRLRLISSGSDRLLCSKDESSGES